MSNDLRQFITQSVLTSGGHFSSNLGVIELTVALHHTLDFPNDGIVWDVGHQSYPHKVLSGRGDLLHTIRSFQGLSGFPKRDESPFDIFGTGHSSTAISAAMGMAAAAKIKSNTHDISANINEPTFVAVVGDGALTAGLSYEALNNLFKSDLNVMIVLNDNHMGIDPNTGALNTRLQTAPEKVKAWFEWFGLNYQGPIDGHNMNELLPAIQRCYNQTGPRLLHIKTIKGKGYPPAEKEQTKWHSASKYVKIEQPSQSNVKWQDVYGDMLLSLAQSNSKIVGITPAMPSSCGMIKAMNAFPDRFFDVGIAEQHALTFAAGMATQDTIPIVNIYSSFLQRGYDQWIHDIALQNLPVILCIDRAGLVGEDGPTHHGAFDIAFLRCIPQTILCAPRNARELYASLWLGTQNVGPIAIRYPKGTLIDNQWEPAMDRTLAIETLSPQWLKSDGRANVLLITTGHATNLAIQANSILLDNHNSGTMNSVDAVTKFSPKIQSSNYHHLHIPLLQWADDNPDFQSLSAAITPKTTQNYEYIITVEDGCVQSGWGEGLQQSLAKSIEQRHNYQTNQPAIPQFQHLGIPHNFIEHGNNEGDLYHRCGYAPEDIAEAIITALAKHSLTAGPRE
ncbi:1-deoxy-D-xylulose-5-phosphate synthase [Bacteroidota bacterium]|nr:1-deoxy-D-xylulose-5-phosphate synthase [Bacteroidota bacterium]